MKNPFESGQIKNYVLLYVSVVVIMVLFFVASTIYREDAKVVKKDFSVDTKSVIEDIKTKEEQNESLGSRIKLLDKAY